MAVLGVDDFKAKLRGGGARPNLFKATINFPGYANGDVELTSFMCEAAQLPASTMATIIVPFRGRQLKMAGDRTFETWTPSIINDTDFNVRDAMERWMNGMNAHATVQPEEWWNKLFEPYKGRFTLDFTTKKPKRQSSDLYNIEETK